MEKESHINTAIYYVLPLSIMLVVLNLVSLHAYIVMLALAGSVGLSYQLSRKQKYSSNKVKLYSVSAASFFVWLPLLFIAVHGTKWLFETVFG